MDSKVKSTRKLKTAKIKLETHRILRKKVFDSEGKETIGTLIDKAVRSFYNLDRTRRTG